MDWKEAANKYIPAPRNSQEVLYNNGDTQDIMHEVLECFNETKGQLKKFAQYLKGDNVYETCNNIWQFVKSNIRYKIDPPGVQWVKEPARVWADRACDCKSYSIFIAACLDALKIKGAFRFVSFKKDSETPTHVYIVVKSGERTIRIDGVMPRFDAEKPFYYKQDYNMTQISRLAGIPGKSDVMGGFLQNTFVAGDRRRVLQAALPGLAIYALYQWIPAGQSGQTGYREIRSMLSTPDDLLTGCPEIVKQKRETSLKSFWDFGDWANIKVENDLFPNLRMLLTQMLGMDPATWWRKRLKTDLVQGIGEIDPQAAVSAASQAADFLKRIGSAVKGLFGSTQISWRYGDPSVWGPSTDDWTGYPVNPMAALNLGFNSQSGAITPMTYGQPAPTSGGANVPAYTPANPAPQQRNTTAPKETDAGLGPNNSNTLLMMGIGAAAIFWIANRK